MTFEKRARTFREGDQHAKNCDQIYRWVTDPYIFEIYAVEEYRWLCSCQYATAVDLV